MQVVVYADKRQPVSFQIWFDYKLKWNPENYGGITDVRFPGSLEQIWKPDILLFVLHIICMISYFCFVDIIRLTKISTLLSNPINLYTTQEKSVEVFKSIQMKNNKFIGQLDSTRHFKIYMSHGCKYIPKLLFRAVKFQITWFPFDDQLCDLKVRSFDDLLT